MIGMFFFSFLLNLLPGVVSRAPFLSLRGFTNHVDSAQPKASRLSERISRIEQALANSFPELDAGMKHSTEMAVVYLIQISNAGFLPDANAG